MTAKIDKIYVISTESISRQNFPYVKPTDYYIEYLGSLSPFQSAFMDKVCFIRMDLDDNATYSILEISESVCNFVMSNLVNLVRGLPISRINMTWDLLYRYTLPIGRSGIAMHAISVINLLMYDTYAKLLRVPVYELLGGKTRDKIRAYASHLHPASKEELEKEARSYVEEGYTAMKMRFCCGPSDPLGVDRNAELVKVIRDSVGYSVDLAGDAWMSWNLNFALKMARRLEKYELSWIEEPFLPDDFESYSYLSRRTDIPISAGEHHYHVYDFKRLLDSGVRILQPDALWVGGITPMKRIAGLAEAYGGVVIPHTSNIYNLHFIISEPESIAPMAEYLTKYKWLEDRVLNPPKPIKGYFELGEEKGFGLKYDL
ncbi:L-rhamnonate dehydratase [Saccharolobus shibatae]|uniref:Mandelate racemase /muconate lactonizing enzyme related protein (MR/MLE) n=1 Tax=Saccharolobus shibatae TaxID=2286 RepID=A0A8F5C150_9CREN|nr:L-rhamnonate dehydratase [Saccharolobus shibatae]QXJ35018.1 Mandelate racemase /muconate lactonizing enzyme related protein (MR/MLE) [Saccharolobus shibatae]